MQLCPCLPFSSLWKYVSDLRQQITKAPQYLIMILNIINCMITILNYDVNLKMNSFPAHAKKPCRR